MVDLGYLYLEVVLNLILHFEQESSLIFLVC